MQPAIAIKQDLHKKRLVKSNRLGVNAVYCGDCASLLKSFPDDSVDVVITSPPYFQQRGYTGIGVGMEHSVDNYLQALLESFGEMVRVIKPTGSILYNIGDKINGKKGTLLIPYRFAILAAEQHLEISLLNHITWIKSNPTPRQFLRRLVSSTEPFFHFVKSSEYCYYPDDFLVDLNRTKKNCPTERLGEGYFEKIKNSNLLKSEKLAAIRDINRVIAEVKCGKIEGFRVKIRGIHAPAFGGQAGGRNSQMQNNGYTIIRIFGKPLKKDSMAFAVENIKGCGHPAIFPLTMIKELIKLTCPAGGIVLDPYCGSGTTLAAAAEEGRQYIGIDISPEYCNFSRKRVSGK